MLLTEHVLKESEVTWQYIDDNDSQHNGIENWSCSTTMAWPLEQT